MNTAGPIVSLISSATEILCLLGLEDALVGISHECDYPPSIATKPRLTRSLVDSAESSRAIDEQVRELSAGQSALYTIDVPALAALAPRLILTQAQCDVCAVRYADVVDAVRDAPALAGTQILALNPTSLADVFADVTRIAQAAGVAERGQAVLDKLQARVDAVRHATASVPERERPRVACLEWIDPPMLAANWTPELVELAGGQPGLVRAGQHSSYANWDELARYDPQVVVVMPCGFDLPRAIVEAQVLPSFAGWHELSAARAGRVFAADGNAYFNRSGPRLVDSLEILAHLFHPDRFTPGTHLAHRPWRRLATRGTQLVAEEP